MSTEAQRKAGAERVARHDQKMRDAGNKRVSVYVPADAVGRLKKYAARLMKEAGTIPA